MGLVGTIDRTAILSWCPTQIGQTDLFVVASYGGSVDPGFDSGSVLELHSVDSRSNSKKIAENTSSQGPLQKLCSLSCEEKFLKLSWGRKPNNEELGLVAGGFSSGIVKVWDVDKLTSRTSNTPLFSSDRKEAKTSKGPVSALEFSPFISGLLASSGSDSEFYIWDLSLSKPIEERQVKGYSLDSSNLFRGATGASNLASAELTSLTWNKGNQRILATGHVSGLCVIWDLSQKRSVVSFRESDTKKRISCLSWSPVIPVQIITGFDDDKGSSLFIWDLRATKVPMKDLSTHARGVTSVSWCSHDPSLIICTTKDSHCIILHSQTGELLGEVPAESGWNFDVQWSNTLPGLVSVCSLESKVSIWNVVTGTSDSMSNMQATSSALKDSFGEEFASGLPPEMAWSSPRDSKRSKESVPILGHYAPSWMKRRSGVSFCFDGALLYFGVSATHPTQTSPSFVEIQQTHTNPDVLSTNHRIQEMLSEGRLQSFCMEKISQRSSKKDWRTSFGSEVHLDIWEAIALWCSTHPRQELLSHLQKSMSPVFLEDTPGLRLIGYAICPPMCALSDVVPKSGSDALHLSAKEQMNDPIQQQPSGPAPWELDGQDDQTVQSLQEDIVSSHLSSLDLQTKSAEDRTGKLSPDDKPKLVEYLLQGNLSDAVDAAFSDNQPTEALVLASVGGVELFRNARIKYLEYQANATLAFIVACIEEESEALNILKKLHLSDSHSMTSHPSSLKWQEALSLILNYAPPGPTFVLLCNQLGNKLQDELHNSKGAALCFLCAGNIPKLSYSWACEAKQVPHPHRRYRNWKWSNTEDLLEYIQRLMFLRGCISMSESASLYSEELNTIDEEASKAFCDYATLLLAEGECQSALSYLAPLNPETQGTFGIAGELLYRTYWKLGQSAASQLGFSEAPPFPFTSVEPKRTLIETGHPINAASSSPRNMNLNTEENMPQYGGPPVSDSTSFVSNVRNLQDARDVSRSFESLQQSQFPSNVAAMTAPLHSVSGRAVPLQAAYSVSQPSLYTESISAVPGSVPTDVSSRTTTAAASGYYPHPIQAPPSYQELASRQNQNYPNIATSSEAANASRVHHGNYKYFDLSEQVMGSQATFNQQPSTFTAPPPPPKTATRSSSETSYLPNQPVTLGNVVPGNQGTLPSATTATTSSSFSSSASIPPPPPSNTLNTSMYDRSRVEATNVATQRGMETNSHLQFSSTLTPPPPTNSSMQNWAMPSHTVSSGETTGTYGNIPSQANKYSATGNADVQVSKELPSQHKSPAQTTTHVRSGIESNSASISSIQRQPSEQSTVPSLPTSGPFSSAFSSYSSQASNPSKSATNISSPPIMTESPSGKDTRGQITSVPTLSVADISRVPSNYKLVVDTLRAFYSHCQSLNQQPIYKRKLDDVNRKLGQLVTKLNNGEVNDEIGSKLIELCKMLGQGNYDGASKVQVVLTQQHWEGNSSWIIALKRLIEAGKTGS
ncbi:hypothetical protein GpartN1_g3834.t1 [Galdieria partita]|uniref:Sec16 Sec23-binding domain-containing protein n=1 Tax=Galdieria partita TaxID=83374 RepID=A0A9C7PWD6_9RHOD|nr:hypothetical protein GpartN1_g3834.t1 [Galdieria partita]